jgi:hypothetical protein
MEHPPDAVMKLPLPLPADPKLNPIPTNALPFQVYKIPPFRNSSKAHFAPELPPNTPTVIVSASIDFDTVFDLQ